MSCGTADDGWCVLCAALTQLLASGHVPAAVATDAGAAMAAAAPGSGGASSTGVDQQAGRTPMPPPVPRVGHNRGRIASISTGPATVRTGSRSLLRPGPQPATARPAIASSRQLGVLQPVRRLPSRAHHRAHSVFSFLRSFPSNLTHWLQLSSRSLTGPRGGAEHPLTSDALIRPKMSFLVDNSNFALRRRVMRKLSVITS